jgi:electron transfer flavoprotein alpha subunit
VLHVCSPDLAEHHPGLAAQALCDLLRQHSPTALLLAHGPETAELAGRLGALSGSAVITRAADAHLDGQGRLLAERPIDNGFLFETVAAGHGPCPVLTFLPSVLADPQPLDGHEPAEITRVTPALDIAALGARMKERIPADPETLDIEQAEIVVAGGRGVGKDQAFNIIFRLALALGGAVAGTRPVIDWHTLPFERQIGQTGKSVSPRLIINCGISGANEYTAGMEKAQLVIAINSEPQARIFKFADLGVVGDLRQVLPLLLARLEELAGGDDS